MCNDNMVNTIFTKEEEEEEVTTPIPTFVLIVGISLAGLILASAVAISLVYARKKRRKQMEKNDD